MLELLKHYNLTASRSYNDQLLYRGGLLIQWNLYIVVTLGTQPVGCYTEVVCLCKWNLYINSGHHWDTTILQRWSAYYSGTCNSGHHWDTIYSY